MKSKKTKRALVSSALALVLCFVMLLGTTFAWFTDNASTSVNKVQAGTLDVDLEVATKYTVFINNEGKIGLKDIDGWKSAVGQTLEFVKAEGQDEILWEPGCSYTLPPVRVVNNGNLAVKFEVIISGINGDAKLNEAIEWDMPTTYTNGTSATLQPGASAAFKIVGHMKEDAGNAYQGLSIEGIAITVIATQAASEYDSYNNTYDKNATYAAPWDGVTSTAIIPSGNVYTITSAAEFAWVMEQSQNVNSAFAGKTIVLDADIDFGGQTIKGIGSDQCNFAGTFDGQGHTVSNFTVNNTREWYAGLFNQLNGTVKNLTVSNARIIGQKMVGAISSNAEGNAVVENCHVKNCTIISNIKKAGAVVGYTNNATVKNCTATDCTVYCADDDENESGEIVGYVNSGSTLTGNTATNVTVVSGTTATFTLPTEAVKEDAIMMDNISGAAQTKSVYYKESQNSEDQNLTKAGFVIANGTFDGNGNTLTVNSSDWGIQTSGGTVKNVTIEKAGRGIVINQPTADVSIENVTVTSCGYGINTAEHAAKNLYVSNSTIGGWSSWAGLASANFTNCKFVKGSYWNSDVFDQYLRPYITSTFKDCDFVEGMHFDLSKLGEDATVTFSNCTCNGVTLTADNVYNYLHVYLDNNDTEPTSAADLAGKLIFS